MKTLFLGDICPTSVTAPLFKTKKTNILFSDTRTLFKGNDINFINLECALTESEKSISKFGPPLRAPLETAEVLKELGVNCVGLSNNHIFDFGIAGFKSTAEALKNAGIEFTGFGDNYEASRKNFILEKNGEKISIIAVCEHEYSYALPDRMGSRPFDEFDTLKDIWKAKEECDRVIVIYHGGKEQSRYPSPRLVKVCRAMVESGADVVLCQHSHCIGCYENYMGAHILYGQGNFHFVKPMPFDSWFDCLAVKYDTQTNEILFVPIVAGEKEVSIAKKSEKSMIISEFEKRNRELQNGEWKNKWHQFCEELRSPYTNAIGDIKRFAHYLDCEAHTDVWRELFKTDNHTNEK